MDAGLGDIDQLRRQDSVASADVIARYHQSKRNGKSAVAALARFLERVGTAHACARTPQPFSIAAHSLGVHCLQMLLEAGLGPRLPEARNIALLAGCVPTGTMRVGFQAAAQRAR